MSGYLVALHLAVFGVFGVPASKVRAVQWADQAQSVQLQQAWGTPQVRWLRNARIVIYLTTPWNTEQACGQGALGCHGVLQDGVPAAFVAATPDWPVTLSHETVEMLVDPYGQRQIGGLYAEVADPVVNDVYGLLGRRVSDFVTPAWFDPNNMTGPWDQCGFLTGNLQLDWGGYAEGTDGTTYFYRRAVAARGVRPFHSSVFKVAFR